MEEKYILTNETENFNNHILHRIKALKDFGDVKKGDLGGWVENESNLSHKGNCWVYDDAVVYSEAKVMGNAKVFDGVEIATHSSVMGDAEVHGWATVKNYSIVQGNAKVFDGVEIATHSSVKGDAEIRGDVWLDEYSTVQGHAKVTGKYRGVLTLRKALIENYAEVSGDATISMHIRDNAKVDCWDCVMLGGGIICGNARLKGIINIKNYVSIWGNAILDCRVMYLEGYISIEDNAKIQGDHIDIVSETNQKIKIDGDAEIQGNFNICGSYSSNHINSYTVLKNPSKSKLNITWR
ncbi:MAG: hypothetical protein U0L42_11175, partial [Methanobrevibacter sp.]|uniref:hypothetical protein n=1 Tax=Methanobrevibacter sp. TaxID=66852 RepID=UPI002E773244